MAVMSIQFCRRHPFHRLSDGFGFQDFPKPIRLGQIRRRQLGHRVAAVCFVRDLTFTFEDL
jgi:predicted DNA-binding transcriptional regulator AlpA